MNEIWHSNKRTLWAVYAWLTICTTIKASMSNLEFTMQLFMKKSQTKSKRVVQLSLIANPTVKQRVLLI